MDKIFDFLAQWGEQAYQKNKEYYASLVALHGPVITNDKSRTE